MVASLEQEAISGYYLWKLMPVIAFSWNCIVLYGFVERSTS